MSKNNSLANPSRLKPKDADDKSVIKVVVETPKGSRNKLAFDEEEKIFALKKVLPAGMAFPYDFGFVPSTLADDGDPVDVLILMDEPAYPGCLVRCRIIGIIEGRQGKGKKSERNDRVIGVEVANHDWANAKHVADLGKRFLEELEEFFVNYHRLDGMQYKILNARGPKQARKCIQAGIRAYKRE